MNFELFQTPPGPRTVADRGRPALCLPHDGMPAYESETGTLLVMESLFAFFGHAPTDGAPLLMPRSYMMATVRAPSGLAALHDDPDAVWSWRPVLYALKLATTERMGSQTELGYRRGLWDAEMARADLQDEADRFIVEQVTKLRARRGRIPPPSRLRKNERKRMRREYVAYVEALNVAARAMKLPFQVANERAKKILRDHLVPQQRLDLATLEEFYVRGTINKLYAIRPGNGAAIVDPWTREEIVSLCIHPDDWIPDDDVALSLKLMIESGPEGEEELLAGARARTLPPPSRATDRDRRAWEIERELLPAPLITA